MLPGFPNNLHTLHCITFYDHTAILNHIFINQKFYAIVHLLYLILFNSFFLLQKMLQLINFMVELVNWMDFLIGIHAVT